MGQLSFSTSWDVRLSFWKGMAAGTLLGSATTLGMLLALANLLGY